MASFIRGIFTFKDKISPSYISFKNPRFLEMDGLLYSGFLIVNYLRENNDLLETGGGPQS